MKKIPNFYFFSVLAYCVKLLWIEGALHLILNVTRMATLNVIITKELNIVWFLVYPSKYTHTFQIQGV